MGGLLPKIKFYKEAYAHLHHESAKNKQNQPLW